jgi:hypothetical protein
MWSLLLLSCTPKVEPDPSDTSSDDSGETSTDTSGETGADTSGDTSAESESADSGTESDTSEDTGGETAVVRGSFVDDVYAVHVLSCVGCHPWGTAPRATYDRLMEMEEDGWRFFVPGEPTQSLWLQKLTAAPPEGERMPRQLRNLTGAEIDALRAWIDGGATQSGFRTGFFGTWEALSCYDCHSSWGGRDEIAVYEQLTTLVLHAGPMIVPGDAAASILYQKTALKAPPYGVRMPMWSSYLDEEALARIEAWVSAGCVYDGS